MATAAAAVVVAERRIVEAFERAGALSAAAARTPDEVGVDTWSLGWRRLTDRAVIRETAPGSGQYYLDFEVWRAVRRSRMRRAVIIIVILLAVWFYVATIGILRGSASMTHPKPDSAVPSAGHS